MALFLRDELRKRGYKVWIDVEKMRGNIMARMAAAIEGAESIVMVYSTKYAASRNCMAEAMYVAQLGKHFVPVFAEGGCDKIGGCLGIMRGQKIYGQT